MLSKVLLIATVVCFSTQRVILANESVGQFALKQHLQKPANSVKKMIKMAVATQRFEIGLYKNSLGKSSSINEMLELKIPKEKEIELEKRRKSSTSTEKHPTALVQHSLKDFESQSENRQNTKHAAKSLPVLELRSLKTLQIVPRFQTQASRMSHYKVKSKTSTFEFNEINTAKKYKERWRIVKLNEIKPIDLTMKYWSQDMKKEQFAHKRLRKDIQGKAINFSISDGNNRSVIIKDNSSSRIVKQGISTKPVFALLSSVTTNGSNSSSSDQWDAFNNTVDYMLGFYVFLACIGCLGNVYVLVDALKALRRLRTNEMFLIQLCVINILILLTMNAMVLLMKLGFHFTCYVIFSLTSVYIYGIVFTLTTISIQQYYAIAFPFKPKPTVTTMICVMVTVCVTSVTLSLPVIIDQELLPRPCTSGFFTTRTLTMRRTYYGLTALFQYFIPLVIMGVYYSKLAMFLKNSRLEIERHSDNPQFNTPRKKRDRRVVTVMVTIVIIFALCLLPQHAQYFLIEFIYNDTLYKGMAVYTYFPILLKACIDPVVYGAVGRRLRSSCCCRRQTNTGSVGPNT